MPWFFLFFLVSGFCSLVYEVVWLRLAMAQFGVTTPLVSLVLAVFMAGLGLGAWVGAILSRRLERRRASTFLGLYGLVEALIALSGIAVPFLLRLGRLVLKRVGSGWELGSTGYYLVAAALLSLALLPWCTCMGATFPIAMSAMRKRFRERAERSFSYLYLANVLGAVLGTLAPAFILIELLGFSGTLQVPIALNCLLAVGAFALSRRIEYQQEPGPRPTSEAPRSLYELSERSLLCLLFLTGFTSMAMEVVWIRQFTPYLGTVVYAFAAVLAIYLATMFLGSQFYRFWIRAHEPERTPYAWYLAGFFALLPLAAADYRIGGTGEQVLKGALRLALGIGPVCAAFGFLTPMLIDRWSRGDPDRAGRAYAINVVGCLLGPLAAGFVLLPFLGYRSSLVLLALPLFGVGLTPALRRGARTLDRGLRTQVRLGYLIPAALAALLVVVPKAYEEQFGDTVVRRDSTATVVALGDGMGMRLLINGIGTTHLTPITKMMAHLPMACLTEPPRNSLVICFGMGTSFRSLHSWGVPVTAV